MWGTYFHFTLDQLKHANITWRAAPPRPASQAEPPGVRKPLWWGLKVMATGLSTPPGARPPHAGLQGLPWVSLVVLCPVTERYLLPASVATAKETSFSEDGSTGQVPLSFSWPVCTELRSLPLRLT